MFDVRSHGNKFDTLVAIASNLITTDPALYGNNSILKSKSHILLQNLFPEETLFLDKKVGENSPSVHFPLIVPIFLTHLYFSTRDPNFSQQEHSK